MTPTLIGYVAKRIVKRGPDRSSEPPGGFPVGPPVEQLCSVSDCIATAPEGWRDRATHNAFDAYDSPDLAWSVVPTELRKDFDLFAYRLYPVQFLKGQEETLQALEWWDLTIKPMPRSFVPLGWDAVVGGNNASFGCSPLSCNGQAGLPGIPPVNRYCLLSSEQDAFDLARRFSISEPEPGPYCVVEVWRECPESSA